MQRDTHAKSRYPRLYRGCTAKAAPLHLLGSLLITTGIRAFSTFPHRAQDDVDQARLTHISKKTGKPAMVSISDKSSSKRSATAVGTVTIPKLAYELLTDSSGGKNKATRKGDVLTVAQLAGIMGAKRTPDLIPLCHPISLTNVQVELALKDQSANGKDKYAIEVEVTAECVGATGVEMEALTAVNVACLTVWDMLKAVAGKDMIIGNVKVVRKSGGKSGDWERPS
jgi:molybdenum cofactor biosynthesis protein MoaC